MKKSGLEHQFFDDLARSYRAGLDFSLSNKEILFLKDNNTGLAKLEIKAAAEFDPQRYRLYKPIVDKINEQINQISKNPIMNDHFENY